MSQPNFLSDGTTPQRMANRGRTWTKILGVLQNLPGAFASNNPARMDSRRQTKYKVNKAETNTP